MDATDRLKVFGFSAALVASLLARPVAAENPKAVPSSVLTLQSTSDEPENPNVPPPAAPQRGASGDWGGVRSRLEALGLSFAGTLDVDASHILLGGRDTQRTFIREYTDLNLTLDLSKLLQWQGATAFVDLASHHGIDASARGAGDIISFDNIEDPPYVQIAQLWFQQSFTEGISIKGGKIDPIVDFAHMEHAPYFLSSAALYAPTIFPMPTGAHDAAGGELLLGTNQGPYGRLGAFYDNRHNRVLVIEGDPAAAQLTAGGLFAIGEAGWRYQLAGLNGQAALGAWFHNGEFPRVNQPGAHAHGAGGVYAFLDQTLWEEAAAVGRPARDLGGFLLAGWSDARTSAIDGSFTAGLAAKGFVPGRPDDVVGLLGAWVDLPADGLREDRELAAELFYHLQLLRFLALKPDLQYIASPSGNFPDALVLTVRMQLDF